MKKIIISVAVASLFAGSAFAGTHTITGGYAQTRFSDVDLNGVNFKYGYQFDGSPFGIMASISGTGKDTTISGVDVKAEYFAASAGVSYNVVDNVKLYATLGGARAEAKASYGSYWAKDTDSTAVYGVGVQVTPVSGFTIDAGFEHANFDEFGDANTFNVGAGWRF